MFAITLPFDPFLSTRMSFLSRIKSIPAVLWRHKWKTLIALVIGVPVVLGASALSRPKPPEYVTAEAKRGDLVQTVEAVGTVTSDRDLELQFKSSGIVAQVYVKQGDQVRAGQRLAVLRAGSLSANVASAAASVREAEAQLRLIREGNRPEDIAVSEANVENKRAMLQAAQTNLKVAEDSIKTAQGNLDALRGEAQTKLSGQVTLALSTVNEKLSRVDQALLAIDDVFANNDVQDAIIRDKPGEYDSLLKQRETARKALQDIRAMKVPGDYEGAIQGLLTIRAGVVQSANVLDTAYRTVSALKETSYLSAADRETYKATLASEKNAVLAALSALDSAVTTLQDASAGYDTRIATQEAAIVTAQGQRDKAQADIRTYQASLQIDEAQLALKRAGSRQAEIDAADARVRQARAQLARASADLGDTVITAPVSGAVTKVDIKPGELAPIGPAITLLGQSPMRVEMFVSEIDVPKVNLTQSGSVELDAFRDQPFALRVSEIETAPTDVSGVSKYKVMLDFVNPADAVKIGMTGDAEIETGRRDDVVSVPMRAVLQDGEGNKIVRVLEDGEAVDREVTTGMEGAGGNVEIVSGLKEGETVIVLIKK